LKLLRAMVRLRQAEAIRSSSVRSGMKRKKTTEIIVEREQVLVVRRLDGKEPRWCAECKEQAQMVSIDEAAILTCLSARAIYRRVEAGQIHFVETDDGLLLICAVALLDIG
jgi:hypothetical protein